MFPSSLNFPTKSCFKNNNFRVTQDTESLKTLSVEKLHNRFAIRFLLQKSKRFDLIKQQMQRKREERVSIVASKKQSSLESLFYLGLVPKGGKLRNHDDERKREDRNDFQFMKPQIYECDYCSKIFFHKLLHRRHMIRHLKKIQWCKKCNQGFTSRGAKKRHLLTCRR